MKKTLWLCAAIAGLAIGCATNSGSDVAQPSGGDDGSGDGGGGVTGGGGGPGSLVPASCPAPKVGPGEREWQSFILTGGLHLVADAQGGLIYTTDPGIVKLDQNARTVFSFASGDVVAVDAGGNIYVAGVFTAPLDVGRGEMTPVNGNDVFLAKLSPAGEILFVRQGLCTANILPGQDSLLGIAVAPDGRIAISGSTFGVVVLDQDGELSFQERYAGLISFDSKGNLVVGVTFGGDGLFQLAPDVFFQGSADYGTIVIAKYDRAGNYISHFSLAQAAITGLALDGGDNIALIGEFVGSMNLFGQELSEPVSLPFPQGTQFGAIAVRLNSAYGVIWAEEINPFNASVRTDAMFSAMGGLAVNQFGDLIVSSNFVTPTRVPYANPTLAQYNEAMGGTLLGRGGVTAGYGLGVAEDACGNIYQASVQYIAGPVSVLEKIRAER